MKVIIINGPMGAGKTTVGKYIAEKYAGTTFIDGNRRLDIHPFVGNCETNIMAIDNILHYYCQLQKIFNMQNNRIGMADGRAMGLSKNY